MRELPPTLDCVEHDLTPPPGSEQRLRSARVVLLTHYLPPHKVPVLEHVAGRVGALTVLLSTPMESHRDWTPAWGSLDVRVQQGLTLRRMWRHPVGFEEPVERHVPLDTLLQLHRLRPDVVVSFEMGARTVFSQLHAKLRPSVGLVVFTGMSEHSERGRGAARRLLRRVLVGTADVITYNGPSGRRYLDGIGARRLVFAPYAPDPVVRSSPAEGPARRSLLAVGRLSAGKGIPQLLAGVTGFAAAHPEEEVVLTVVGGGPLEERLRTAPRPSNLTVDLRGRVAPARLPAIYREAGALVCASLSDEWGMVVTEALGAGLPVIGSSLAQSVTTLVQDGVNGWAFDPRVDGDLQRALEAFRATGDDEVISMRGRCAASVGWQTVEYAGDQLLRAIAVAQR